MPMENQVKIKGRKFATNGEGRGVFELRGGAYSQHRGTMQTPKFTGPAHLARYVRAMLAR